MERGYGSIARADNMRAAMSAFNMRFLRNEDGATAIEYGLIVAGIAISIIGALNAFGSAIKTSFFDVIAGALGSAP